MKTPSDLLVSEALKALGAATTHREISDGAQALIAGLRLERYCIFDLRPGVGPSVNAVYHNAPPELASEAALLGGLLDDCLLSRARSTLIPFDWQANEHGDPWRHANADRGYRSGVATYSLHGEGSACVVIVSWSGPAIPAEHSPIIQAYTLLAATTLATTLRSFAVRPTLPSPLSDREAACLLYVLAGKSAKETARSIGVEARSVYQYLERARSKLMASTSAAAAMTALRNGWLDMQAALELSGLTSASAGRVSGGSGE